MKDLIKWFKGEITQKQVNFVLERILEIQEDYLQLSTGGVHKENPYGEVSAEYTMHPISEFIGALDNSTITYDNTLEHNGTKFNAGWDATKLMADIERDSAELEKKISAYQHKEGAIFTGVAAIDSGRRSVIEQAGNVIVPENHKRESMVYNGLEMLTEQDVEVMFTTNPQALAGWLENIESIVSASPIDGAQAIQKKIKNANGTLKLFNKFKKYEGEVGNEVVAKVYSQE